MSPLSEAARRRVARTTLLVLTAILLVLSALAWLPTTDGSGERGDVQPFSLVAAVVFTALGAVVVPRRPGNSVGWLFLLIGLAAAVAVAAASWSRLPFAAWLGQWTPWLAYGLLPLPLLQFPDGRLPSRRWRWLLVAGLAGVVVPAVALAVAAVDQPTSLLTEVDTVLTPRDRSALAVAAAGVVLSAIAVAGSLAALWVRWRTANGEGRDQLKWLVVGAAGCVVGLILETAGAPGAWLVGAAAIPASATVAILRHRLYDVDLFINRLFVYLVLTAFVVIVYSSFVDVLGALFGGWQGPGRSLVATAAVAAAFHPVQVRVQRAVDRLLFGDRANPYAAVTRVNRSMDRSTASSQDPADILRSIAAAVAEALRLPYVALQVDGIAGLRLVAEHGRPTGHPLQSIAMTHQGREVGQLIVSPRSRREHLTTSERRLLRDLATQAGLAAAAVVLNVEVKRSRERLVRAREEERRRLRRDLHDGLGAALAGLRMQVSTAPYLLETQDDAALRDLLRRLDVELGRYTADIRRLIEGLAPAALDQLGLPDAIRRATTAFEHGTDALQIHLTTADVPLQPGQLPAAVEIAAYHIAVEAITNAARHARASWCRVHLALTDGDLVIEVTDNGDGLAPDGPHRVPAAPGRNGARHGVGLDSLRERTTELGGVCVVDTLPGSGARVFVRLPLAAS